MISLLICTSELAETDGMMNVESLCVGIGLKSGV